MKVFIFSLVQISVISSSVLAKEAGDPSEVLFGLAAIVSAGSPAVIAGIGAARDESIARTEGTAAIDKAVIKADETIHKTNAEELRAARESGTALKLNAQNQTAQTGRETLAFLERTQARNQEEALKRDDMYYNYSLARRELQEKEAERKQRLEVEKMRLELAKVQAGVSPGFTRVATTVTVPQANEESRGPSSVFGLGSNPTVETQVARALNGSQRLLGNVGTNERQERVSSELVPGFGSLAQGSTRAVRQRGVSDLSSFRASVASEENYPRHQAPIDHPSH